MDIKPSEKMKLNILQSGKDYLIYKTNVPNSGLVPTDGGKEYKVICRHCKEILCTFKSKTGSLKDAYDMEGYSRVDMKKWSGLRGINISDSEGARFECNCGKADIYDVETGQKRYVEIKIVDN